MNRRGLLLLAITILWLATAVVAYTSWQDFTNKRLTGWIGWSYLIHYGYPSFFQTSFFTVVLVGCLVIVLAWVGYICEHPRFSLGYKNPIFIFAGIVFIILGAYLLKYAWTLEQNVNFLNEKISTTTSPMAPVYIWRQEIDSWQPLILASALNGVIHVATSMVLFSFSRTRVARANQDSAITSPFVCEHRNSIPHALILSIVYSLQKNAKEAVESYIWCHHLT